MMFHSVLTLPILIWISLLLILVETPQPQPRVDFPSDLKLFEERFKSFDPFDPIVLTRSERVHGWSCGDGTLAFLLMYEATGDTNYLKTYIEYADRLLSLRDSERGIPDRYGRLQPGWSHEPSYLSNQVLLPNAAGEPTLSFLTPPEHEWRLESRQPAFLRVQHLTDERFRIVLVLNSGTAKEEQHSWDNLTMNREADSDSTGFYAPSQIGTGQDWLATEAALVDYLLVDQQLAGSDSRRKPAEGEFPLQRGHQIRVTNTGPVVFPMTYFARLVRSNEELSQHPLFRRKADEYIEAARRAVAIHDDQWRQNERGEGWYVVSLDSPSGNAGYDEPFNRSNTVGLALLELAELTGERQYLNRAERLARAFKNNMTLLPKTDSYVWGYWLSQGAAWQRVGGEQETEDIGHAGVNVIFAYQAYRHGVVFAALDLSRMANTWIHHAVDSENLTTAFRLDGSGQGSPDEMWRMLFLGTVDSRVYDFARRWYLTRGDLFLQNQTAENAANHSVHLPTDPIAARHSPYHRMRLGWAAMAFVASQLAVQN